MQKSKHPCLFVNCAKNEDKVLDILDKAFAAFSSFMWGTPLLFLLLGGGFFFLMYSGFLPFRWLGHAVNVLRGKYDDPDDPGDINHYEALSGALAATVGMGNISGVAVAIMVGGPGTLFWMWTSAFLGMATKFFTCTLAVMYRGENSQGKLEGGPMYVIREGMGKSWKFLAILFSVAGLFGVLPLFQANQLTEVVRDILLVPNGLLEGNPFYANLSTGLFIVTLVGIVIFGGIKRIGKVAGKMVPLMVLIYILSVLLILVLNYESIPESFSLIFTDAFTGNALMGGAAGEVIRWGARRAAFSNEAGIGTAPMMHGAAKTQEPVREGLVAMLGPAIDTLIVCTMTALAILVTGVWKPQINQNADIALEVNIVEENTEVKIEVAALEYQKEGTGKLTLENKSNYEDLKIEKQLVQSQKDNHILLDIPQEFPQSKKVSTTIKSNSKIPLTIEKNKDSSANEWLIKENRDRGITVTADAFHQSIPYAGKYILMLCILIFSFTTLFSMSYYGTKCTEFLFGASYKSYYNYFYLASIVFGAISPITAAINFIDGMYAVMAIPTMVSAIWLSPKVIKATKKYFREMKHKPE